MSVFTSLRESIAFLDEDTKLRIVQNMIHVMNLDRAEEYQALKIFNFERDVPLDYERACKVFDKSRVDEILKEGTFVDDFHPLTGKDLGHWNTPDKRRQYYEEYMANSVLRRTGSMSVRLHQNFTIAQLEYMMSSL